MPENSTLLLLMLTLFSMLRLVKKQIANY
ncbi:MAG: hypothetical protein EOO86_11320 [Pedobacter sp.]|nr:MAG: hypothetical protein EOO86_11320 [Pedobacter sp.]